MAISTRSHDHRPGVAHATGLRTLLLVGGLACGGGVSAGEVGTSQDRGKELFTRVWVPGDPRSHGGDGLGPVYNESSCVACHNQGGPGGAGPADKNVEIVTLTGIPTAQELVDLHPGFQKSPSLVLHQFGTDPEYKLWRLRRTAGLEFADMAQEGGEAERAQVKEMVGIKPTPRVVTRRARARPTPAPPTPPPSRVTGHMLLKDSAAITQRNPPPLFGIGLIDSLPSEVFREARAQVDPEFPETKGRFRFVRFEREGPPGRPHRREIGVGRFGWKSQVATLEEFVLSACANELGLEVPGHHQAESPLADGLEHRKTRAASGQDPKLESDELDMTGEECADLVAFVGQLRAPSSSPPSHREDRPFLSEGRKLFNTSGCAACHRPKLGPINGIYSDLLLHDMGPELADAGSYYGGIGSSSSGGASAQEWRTPPLWGFRDSAPYLHDGRAKTLEQAVAFHGGQAERSSQRFFKLSPQERLQVQTFLSSLAVPTDASEP